MVSILILVCVISLAYAENSRVSSLLKDNSDQLSLSAKQFSLRRDSSGVCTSAACTDVSKTILEYLDLNNTVDPCEDFDKFVCEKFRRSHEYRQEQKSVSTRTGIQDVTTAAIRDILEGPYNENITTPAFKAVRKRNYDKMKTAYNACMNEEAIEKAGITPLRTMLDELEVIYPLSSSNNSSSSEQLTNALIWLSKNSISTLLRISPTLDNKDPTIRSIGVDSGKVGLPSKEYYTKPDILANYTRTIVQMFGKMAAGKNRIQSLTQISKDVIELETKIKGAAADPAKARDVTYYYNPTAPSDIDVMVPQISVTNLIKAQIPQGFNLDKVILTDPEYYGNISSIITSTSRETLHAYFQWHLIKNLAGGLHRDISKPLRVFNNQLAGLAEDTIQERWKLCLEETDSRLGWILSGFYVERAFSPEAKKYGERIIGDIKTEFSERLKDLDWMSDAVKTKAAGKVVNILPQVGYPTSSPAVLDHSDVNKYYKALEISNSYFRNGRSFSKFSYDRSWIELLQPVDPNKQSMTATTVNANFNSVFNRISFPAAGLQAPPFGLDIPEYISYGGFGTTAGHELTHGFDNSGSKYDEAGRYRAWWDNSTLLAFKARAQCFVDQYSNYTIQGIDGEAVHVNGKLTQGENIADAGGLASSFAAWKKRDKENPNPNLPGLERFSKAQLFFISNGIWRCGKMRTAEMVKNIYTDPHSPFGVRPNGGVANSKGFREAFNCPIKKPTCELW